MRFSSQFLEELKKRLPVSEVVGRYVSLQKKGREWSGLSPFVKEKTASFFVNDQKAFYHDFSSGKHGDIISFISEKEGLSFGEAVEHLAKLAGISLPENKQIGEDVSLKLERLYALLEDTAIFFQEQLSHIKKGKEAQEYLLNRGIIRQSQNDFRLGYAPSERGALKSYLQHRKYSMLHQYL